jgi:hypothetical protein
MPEQHVRLRDALRARHWQTYRTFCREYDRAAKGLDPHLVGTWPSRAQFHRWLAGDLKGLPFPDHQRVLEAMLPDWTTAQLFERCGAGCPLSSDDESPESLNGSVARSIEEGLKSPGVAARNGWSRPSVDGPVLGHASVSVRTSSDDELALPELMARRVLALGQVERYSPRDIAELSALAGNIVDLSLVIDLDVAADGLTSVTYRYYQLNLTDSSVSRAARDLWFQHSRGKLDLSAARDGDRNVTIQRLHTADNMAKFACQFSPAIDPGETVKYSYTCSGGEFRKDFYWRQMFSRHTRQYALNVRHGGLRNLGGLTATEELPDGTEVVRQQAVSWRYEGDDAAMSFTLDRIQPGQYATLRWESG